MARQSFFRSPVVRTDSKYGAYAPDTSLTAKFKVIILLVALIGGGAVGVAYSYIAAPDLNRVAREKLRPGADLRQREQARKLAARRMEMKAQWEAEAEAQKQKEIAEKLAQVNPLRTLLGGQASETTASEDGERPTRPERRPRPRATPAGGESLQDVAEQARRMLEQTGKK